MAPRLKKLSQVRPEKSSDLQEMDTVKYAKIQGSRRSFDILMEAQNYWNNMDQFRKDRERCKRYTYGDQWIDMIKDSDGCIMSEKEYIEKQGNVALQNNLIRRLVRSVKGVYRSQSKEPTCVARDRAEQELGEIMSVVLQYNMQLNEMSEMYANTMEDFLIGGLVVHRKCYGYRNEKTDCWTDYINPNNFFIDTNMKDFRGWDVTCLGEVHDISFSQLVHAFAKSPEDFQQLRNIYSFAHSKYALANYGERFGYSRIENYDFLFVSDPTRCRVIEVWRKETKPRYRCHDWNTGDLFKIEIEDYKTMVKDVNEKRIKDGLSVGMLEEDIPLIEATWFIDNYWYYYFLSPFGHVLKEGETPYAHKSHPYVFKAYPFIDGEIHSFVADVIDQQRYTNRLISMFDWIMRASAKGVLMFPEALIPDKMTEDDIADEWARFNGVIFFKPKQGAPMPQQIANNCTNIGISELLNLQLKFFEDISGVHNALQGKPGFAGQSAALYNQQTQNSTITLLDILESFSSFIVQAAYKDVKNIQQFYDQKRVFKISGKNATVFYDPEKIRETEFDLSIVESTATPAYRQLANDILLQLWQAQAISVQQLLEYGDFPFADDLLQSINSQQEQIEKGQTPQGLSPEVLAQAQQGTNMTAVNQAYQALRNGADNMQAGGGVQRATPGNGTPRTS